MKMGVRHAFSLQRILDLSTFSDVVGKGEFSELQKNVTNT